MKRSVSTKQFLFHLTFYELLLNHTFVGNIGELTNTIQASCVSALYKSNSDTLEYMLMIYLTVLEIV